MEAKSLSKVPESYKNHTCSAGTEAASLSVSCSGNSIQAIDFLDWGTPIGTCSGGFTKSECSIAANFTALVARLCVGQESCAVQCSGQGLPGHPGHCTIAPAGPFCSGRCKPTEVLVPDPCKGTKKNGAFAVKCTIAPTPPSKKTFKYVFDFGQEFAGVTRLMLPAGTPRGVRITLKHAETLGHPPLAPADGSVYMGNLFWANPVDVYITKGGAEIESYEPSFTYHGFRYVELSLSGGALSSEPTLATLLGVNFRSAVAESASIMLGSDSTTPDNVLQKLSNNSWWTEAAALMSIPAGAAGRGERNGWTGDAAFASESESFDFDTGAFFSRYLAQVADAQGPNGEVGGGVPAQGTAPATLHNNVEMPFDPSWSAVLPLVAYNLWKYYGGNASLEYAWPGLQKYMRMLDSNYTVSPLTFGKWGDWNPAYPAPRNPQGQGSPFKRTVSHVTAAAMVVQNFIEVAEMARGIGKYDDAARYDAAATASKKKFHASFFDPQGQIYGDGTPTAIGAALWLELTPSELVPHVVKNLVQQLHHSRYRMTSLGFIGVRYVFEALAKVNRTDVALKMLRSTEYPSFGWCISNPFENSTSLWESYDVPTMPQWVAESSRNHHYSASINTFLRKYLAGLDQPVGSNAWSIVKCRPEAAFWPELLPTATAALHSRRGAVRCSWEALQIWPPPPPPPPIDPPVSLCVYSPIWTGAVSGPAPLTLRCPSQSIISSIDYARFQNLAPPAAQPDGEGGWHCYLPGGGAPNHCESNVSATIATYCLGKPFCNLSDQANIATLGRPCASSAPGPLQLIVRVRCSINKGFPIADRGILAESAPKRVSSELLDSQSRNVWVTVNVSVPGGSIGEVHVPVRNGGLQGTITESGVTVWQDDRATATAPPGVRFMYNDGRFVIFETVAGNFSFSSA